MLFTSIWVWVNTLLWPSSFEKNLTGNHSTFQLIGAGLQRTGTFSTRIALTKLLGGKCFHGFTGSMDPNLADFWLRAAYGKVTDEGWKDYLLGQGYISGVGEPISLFFEDLMKVFPDAKVLLTQRPADKWYRSMQKAIIEPRGFLERPPISWVFDYWGYVEGKHIMEEVRDKVAENRNLTLNSWSAVEAGKETAMKFFDEWNQMVIDKVPKERLLVFDASEGWEPLCKFLGLPVPDEPFPKINDSWTIEWLVKGSYYMIMLGIPSLVFAIVCWKSKRTREFVLLSLHRIFSKVIYPIVYCVTNNGLSRRFRGYTLLKQK